MLKKRSATAEFHKFVFNDTLTKKDRLEVIVDRKRENGNGNYKMTDLLREATALVIKHYDEIGKAAKPPKRKPNAPTRNTADAPSKNAPTAPTPPQKPAAPKYAFPPEGWNGECDGAYNDGDKERQCRMSQGGKCIKCVNNNPPPSCLKLSKEQVVERLAKSKKQTDNKGGK